MDSAPLSRPLRRRIGTGCDVNPMGRKTCVVPILAVHCADIRFGVGETVADRSAGRRLVERGQVEAVLESAIGIRLGNETHPL